MLIISMSYLWVNTENKQFERYVQLGDNCICIWKFHNINWRFDGGKLSLLATVTGASKWIFATMKSTIDAVKFSNTLQLSPF